jgi:hypothetical protein
MIPVEQLKELANHHSCPRGEEQLSACDILARSFSGERDAETSKGDSQRNRFFRKFSARRSRRPKPLKTLVKRQRFFRAVPLVDRKMNEKMAADSAESARPPASDAQDSPFTSRRGILDREFDRLPVRGIRNKTTCPAKRYGYETFAPPGGCNIASGQQAAIAAGRIKARSDWL